MWDFLLPGIFALLLWWASTGVVLFLDGLPRRTFPWSLAATTVLFGFALHGLWDTRNDTSVSGAYAAFGWGLAAWAWQELSYYTGYVTGPRKHACAPGCHGWKHFGHALQTSAYHELAILLSAIAIVALTAGGTNPVGAWTFLLLWFMHESARINVFLGVRNVNAEWLPEHLQYLRSFLTKKPMNVFFPVAISVLTGAFGFALHAALGAPTGSFEAVGLTLLAALLFLGIIEHWFLVLPIPLTAPWKWALGSRDTTVTGEVGK